VVIDAAATPPGPLTGLDVSLKRPRPTLRVGVQQRNHPFKADDPVLAAPVALRRAAARAGVRRLFVLSMLPIDVQLRPPVARFRRVEARTYTGVLGLSLIVYAQPGQPAR